MRKFHITASLIQHAVWLPLRLLFTLFISLEISGIDRVKKLNTSVVFACNHMHELDPLILVSCLPFWNRHIPLIFVAGEKKFYANMGWRKNIYGGLFFRLMGALPAYSGLNNYDKALDHHFEAVKNERSICIFPMGKRHKNIDLHEAKGGVSYLAFRQALPIIPVRIEGIEEMSMTDLLFRRRKLQVTFGEPYTYEDISRDAIHTDSNKDYYEDAAAALMKKIMVLV